MSTRAATTVRGRGVGATVLPHAVLITGLGALNVVLLLVPMAHRR